MQKALKNAEERVREAAAEALNESATMLTQQIRSNMDAQGIKERTGALRGSVGFERATKENISLVVKSEVYAKKPRRPGLYNPRMRGRYRNGTAYGRLIEFSPRISKPFFYTAWYKDRKKIKEDVIAKIGNAWAGK